MLFTTISPKTMVASSKTAINLCNKISQFMVFTNRKKSIQLTLITTYGAERNSHYGIINTEIILDDLFA